MPDERHQLIYEESQRALSDQQAVLDGIHSRTGVFLALASVATSLLAGQSFQEGRMTCWSWLALGAFLLLALFALAVLWPRSGWFFAHDVEKLRREWLEERNLDIDVMRIELASYNQESWAENKKKLDRMFRLFEAAVGALVLEVALWVVDLGSKT